MPLCVRPLVALALVALAPALAATACARGGSTSPEGAIVRFREAVERGRYRDAYRSTSREYRQQVSLAEFRRQLENHPGETETLLDALSEIDDRAEVVATIPYGDGQEVRLVLEGRRWRIADNIVNLYDQSTPRNALASFVRAMERRRYDIVMNFVPDADREGMTIEQMQAAWDGEGREDIDRLLANLRASVDNPIEEIGNRATMPYGERYTVRFLFEDGVWKIEDPD